MTEKEYDRIEFVMKIADRIERRCCLCSTFVVANGEQLGVLLEEVPNPPVCATKHASGQQTNFACGHVSFECKAITGAGTFECGCHSEWSVRL
jgi:hypothetical protein